MFQVGASINRAEIPTAWLQSLNHSPHRGLYRNPLCQSRKELKISMLKWRMPTVWKLNTPLVESDDTAARQRQQLPCCGG
ncbi:hypothetical protein CEXT_447521 [Caerostris extrusa]|uniref:Uncharacterized protein n=1 Tax=Caerostris extrusa TaxID=172846 RepID=A0AAV4N030_CAEEX|nr:hypothetical protein CEXT_447521 [Caerostris extrusa]